MTAMANEMDKPELVIRHRNSNSNAKKSGSINTSLSSGSSIQHKPDTQEGENHTDSRVGDKNNNNIDTMHFIKGKDLRHLWTKIRRRDNAVVAQQQKNTTRNRLVQYSILSKINSYLYTYLLIILPRHIRVYFK